ncbi:hypothetical protein [Vibrio splendidus]|nr:hypothetical protein [Vibrio splendidus]
MANRAASASVLMFCVASSLVPSWKLPAPHESKYQPLRLSPMQ